MRLIGGSCLLKYQRTGTVFYCKNKSFLVLKEGKKVLDVLGKSPKGKLHLYV